MSNQTTNETLDLSIFDGMLCEVTLRHGGKAVGFIRKAGDSYEEVEDYPIKLSFGVDDTQDKYEYTTEGSYLTFGTDKRDILACKPVSLIHWNIDRKVPEGDERGHLTTNMSAAYERGKHCINGGQWCWADEEYVRDSLPGYLKDRKLQVRPNPTRTEPTGLSPEDLAKVREAFDVLKQHGVL